MVISLLVAVDQHKLIGHKGTLPWRLPADVKYFKEITMGHPIVMGRKTWESLPKRPLPGRKNIVLTQNINYEALGAEIIHDPSELANKVGQEEVFVIGGAQVFNYFLPVADRLYITEIDHEFAGDTYFPPYDINEWRLVSEQEGQINEENHYVHRYLVYERK